MESVVSRLEAVAARLEKYESSIQVAPAAAPSVSSRSVASTSTSQTAARAAVAPAPSPPPQATGTPGKYDEAAWVNFVATEVNACDTSASALAEEFRGSTVHFVNGAKVMVDVIKLSQKRAKPSMDEFQGILQPLADAMQKAESLTHGARTKATNHHKAITECIQTFAWVSYDVSAGAPTPDAAIVDGLGSSEMFINRVIMDHRDSAPEHKVWALAVKDLMKKLHVLAKLQFPMGLTWTGTGTGPTEPTPASKPEASQPEASQPEASQPEASQPETSQPNASQPEASQPEASQPETSQPEASQPETSQPEASTAPAAPESTAAPQGTADAEPEASTPEAEAGDGTAAAEEPASEPEQAAAEAPAAEVGAAGGPKTPPPPPPPPPPGMLLEKLKASGGGGSDTRGALMSALNRGEGVTSGLRKVTDDMKTKNQKDRPGMVKAPVATKKAVESRGPPRKELQMNRWQIENWVACEGVELKEEEVQRSHAVYISHCSECVVQVNGKVNTIMLDGCRKVGLVFGSVVSTVELVNCSSCKVQCNTTCPTLNIDKTDGAQVYLSEEAAAVTEVVTSKSSSMSVTVLPGADDGEPSEHPVPEQYMSKVVDGKLVTVPVSHM